MGSFSDDFNRANGDLGGNWVVTAGAPTINSQRVTAASAASACNTTVSDGDYLESSCTVIWNTGSSYHGGPTVKASTGNTNGFALQLRGNAAPYTVVITTALGASSAAAATYTIDGTPPPWTHLKLIYDHGHLSGYYEGALVLEYDSGLHALQMYCGFTTVGGAGIIDDFTAVSASAVALEVSPNVIGNYGSAVPLTFTGTGTAWTPGTPGSPTFTVDHGTLSDQVIASATLASANYDPGSYLGAVIFTDPSTGAIATAIVSSNPNVVPPSLFDPWMHDEGQLVIDTIHKTAPTLLRTDNIVLLGQWGAANLEYIQAIAEIWAATHYDYANPAGAGDLAQQLNQVWRIVNGGYTVPLNGYDQPDSVPIKQSVKIALDQLEAVRTANNWTLGSVITEIAGTGAPQISDVLDAIAGIGSGSNQDVLDALAAYFGANPPTIQQLGTMVSDLATVAGYTLGDVLTAIAAIPGTDLSPIMDKLEAIQPSETFTLSSIAGDAGSSKTAAVAAEAALALLTGDGAFTLATVLDAISALSDLVSALDTSAGAPVWPGIDGVDLLDPIAVTNAYTFTGTCDGILLSILQELVKQPTMKIGTISTYRTMGRVAFVSDSGEIEPWQPIPGSACVLMPRQLLHAGGFIIGFYHTVDATVVPWTIKASS